ncbi:MAG: thioredoxin [Chlamydiota bacterium]
MAKGIKMIDDSSFEETIKEGVVLVDFYADWCGPCRMLAPILEEVAEAVKGKAVIAKLDVDQAQQTASTYQVTSIPTIILFKDGKEVNRVVGVQSTDSLKSMIESA